MPIPTPDRQSIFRATLVITAVLAIGVAVATLLPGRLLPDSPMSSDKLDHALAFGLLTLPIALVKPKSLLWAAPMLVVYGVAIELLQPLMGRSREIADFGADVVGIVTGGLLGYVGHRVGSVV